MAAWGYEFNLQVLKVSLFSQQERINRQREELEKQKKALAKRKPVSNTTSKFTNQVDTYY